MNHSSNYYCNNKYSVVEEENQKSAAPETDLGGKDQTKEISIFGVKISYSKAFGIVFLILFILLFFPGIGVSSSSASKDKGKGTADNDKSGTEKNN